MSKEALAESSGPRSWRQQQDLRPVLVSKKDEDGKRTYGYALGEMIERRVRIEQPKPTTSSSSR